MDLNLNNLNAANRELAPAARTYPVDVEHAGIRIVLPILIVVGGLVIYFLLMPFIGRLLLNVVGTDEPGGFVTAIIALVGALGIGALGDRLLKQIWPSGRTLHLSPETLRLHNGRRGHSAEVQINLGQRINPQAWRFAVKRSSPRAPSGWQMLAFQVAQDDQEMIVYTFMPPKKAAALPQYGLFSSLSGRREIEQGKLSLRETTEQRRLLKAENTRWEDGAELRPDDFSSVLEALIPHIPEWQKRSEAR